MYQRAYPSHDSAKYRIYFESEVNQSAFIAVQCLYTSVGYTEIQ